MVDGYTAVYGSDEISEPIIDLGIAVLAFFVGVGSLIAIIVLWRWYKGKTIGVG